MTETAIKLPLNTKHLFRVYLISAETYDQV